MCDFTVTDEPAPESVTMPVVVLSIEIEGVTQPDTRVIGQPQAAPEELGERMDRQLRDVPNGPTNQNRDAPPLLRTRWLM